MAYIDSLQEFLREVQAYCATESIAPSTLTNRVLGHDLPPGNALTLM